MFGFYFNKGKLGDLGGIALIAHLDGNIFTPYSSNWYADQFRLYPPMWIWWYTLNYVIYTLDIAVWRIVNFFLEIGIVYVLIQIFRENSATEKGWKDGNFTAR